MKPHVVIIGGGASGIAAAITAAEQGARVDVLEERERLGHSILVSGNGRCNWSNDQVEAGAYTNAAFVDEAFSVCPPRQVWDWFAELGLCTLAESDGRLYPQTNKASTALDVLRFRMDELSINVLAGTSAARIEPTKSGYAVHANEGHVISCDAVIVAVGGAGASRLLPRDCRFTERHPRLCPLQTAADAVRGLDGIRARAVLSLVRDDKPFCHEQGEVQFRAAVVSGIATINLSRFARKGDTLSLDFLPRWTEENLAAELRARSQRFPQRDLESLLAGMVLPQLARAIARQAGLRSGDRPDASRLDLIARGLKAFRLPVMGFEEKKAQVTQGGLDVGEVDARTMELRRHVHLHVTGEALDVDGPCGGYNLHWAWTSGTIAGRAAVAAAADPAAAAAVPTATGKRSLSAEPPATAKRGVSAEAPAAAKRGKSAAKRRSSSKSHSK